MCPCGDYERSAPAVRCPFPDCGRFVSADCFCTDHHITGQLERATASKRASVLIYLHATEAREMLMLMRSEKAVLSRANKQLREAMMKVQRLAARFDKTPCLQRSLFGIEAARCGCPVCVLGGVLRIAASKPKEVEG